MWILFSDEKGEDQDAVKEDEEDENEKIKKQLIDDEEEDRKLLESIPDESTSCWLLTVFKYWFGQHNIQQL